MRIVLAPLFALSALLPFAAGFHLAGEPHQDIVLPTPPHPPEPEVKHFVYPVGTIPDDLAQNFESKLAFFEKTQYVDVRIFIGDEPSLGGSGLGDRSCELLDAEHVGRSAREGGIVLLIVPNKGAAVCSTYAIRPILKVGEMNSTVRAMNALLTQKGDPASVAVRGLEAIMNIMSDVRVVTNVKST